MKAHIKRKIEYSKDAIPEKGTKEYEAVTRSHEENLKNNPKLKALLDKKMKSALNTLNVQNTNGIQLNMDSEIRHFLNEFNRRSWQYGHRHMPSMFNILESFFNLDKNLNYWELLEEEDYLISYFDFIDYYTSNTFEYNLNTIKEMLTEDLILNYNIGADINEITFKADEGNEFVIAGISMVRRGNEVSFMFLSGQKTDTSKITIDLPELPKTGVPGKEDITPAVELTREAIKLNNDPNLWKVLIACRFDLETKTIDARYVAKDEGNSYSIITDDITGFRKNGQWITPDLQQLYISSVKDIENYNSIFELAKASLYLPQYFNTFENDILEEVHETKLKSIINNIIKKNHYKDVDDKFKLRTRSLWILNRKNIFSPDRIVVRDDQFKIENSGHWKILSPEEIGTDKKGRQITGKTWVSTTESYYQANTDELIVTRTPQKEEFTGKNAGYIYVMRNAMFEENIFKIGLTTKDTKDRAKQLSKTSVPDHFFIVREWAVKDCKVAEAKIHEILNGYRIDPRREFFKIDMKTANETIDKVIERINNENG